MRIAHISDVHIRLKDRHDEYKEVFDRLYKELKTQNPDRILLGGDIVHSKITLSPELVSLSVDFISSLSTLAPVDLIVGNHDMNMSNTDRMDALTPIVDAARHDSNYDINYMLDTGMYEFVPGFHYGVYSLLDGGDIHLRKADKKDGDVYIALFHGCVAGCQLDNDYVVSEASMSVSTFDNFDFVMLGDIHKVQFLNKKKTIAYCGSLIQQNFAEGLDKGFLMWDIKTADDFTCEFVQIENDYAYYTIKADDGMGLPNITLPPKTRVRVEWEMKASDISRAEATRINSLIKSKYDPLSIQLRFKPLGNKTTFGDVSVDESTNLADPTVQSDLLKQWINNLEDEVDMEALMAVDKQVTDMVTLTEFEDFSNSSWTLKKATITNFMSYDTAETIDFNEMRGVIGLFGDNTAGKSVIIDAILYALFNKTTRGVKNEDLVNKYTESDECNVELHMDIKGAEYVLKRTTIRKYQKRTGEFDGSKTDVSFKRRYNEEDEWENLKGAQRNETEIVIRNAIGSFDDFMITTLSTQGGQSEFLSLKKSPRADTMLRFLGLDVFSQKHDKAKDLLKQINMERKSHDRSQETEMLDTKKKSLAQVKRDIKSSTNKIDVREGEIEKIRANISTHETSINKTINLEKDADALKVEFDSLGSDITSLDAKTAEVQSKIAPLVARVVELEETFLLDNDKILELTGVRDSGEDAKKTIRSNFSEIETHKRVLKVHKDDLNNETQCPVMDDKRHTSCAYLSAYITKKDECTSLISIIEGLQAENISVETLVESTKYATGLLEEQDKIMLAIEKATSKADGYKKEITANEYKLEVKSISLKLVKSQLDIAESNEDIMRSNKEHREAIVSLDSSLKDEIRKLGEHVKLHDQLTSQFTLLNKEIADIEDTLARIQESDNKYNLFNTYCKAMHRSGLPVDVLRSHIPSINYEINKILSDVVNFGVFLKIDDGGTDIDIVMRYDSDQDDTRPAAMASGMEKLLINMAIRYALLSVSNLNTSSTWFIDEGFGVLDAENLTAMAQFFTNVKSVFKNIVIITHIDALKDVADWIIGIEKKGGISLVNRPVKNI